MISPRDLFRLLPDSTQKALKAWVTARTIHQREVNAINHLTRVATALTENSLRKILTLEDWELRREGLRKEVWNMLGIDKLSDVVSTKATLTGIIEKEKYRIEKWLFEHDNGLYCTTNLYIPANTSGHLPVVLYQCGHWPTLDGAKTGYQDRYLWYPENGFALLVIDPYGFGEIKGIHHGTCRLNRWDWVSKGYTPAGLEVWNAMRLLDWLAQRDEIDSNRIAATGISGGGVMTQYLAAIDDRIKVAVASCSTYTLGHQASQNLIVEQCDCTYLPNIYQIDFPEVLALIAPRPLLILGGKKDELFPPDGFNAAFAKAKGIFERYPDGHTQIKLVDSNAGHTDPPHFLEETRTWICKWLHHNIPSGSNYTYPTNTLEANDNLKVITEYPLNSTNAGIDTRWTTVEKNPAESSTRETAARKLALATYIRNQLFRWAPYGQPTQPRHIFSSGGFLGDLANYQEYVIQTENGVEISVKLCLPKAPEETMPLLVWVKDVKDNVYFPDVDEFFPFLSSHALVIVNPRFTEKYLSAREYTRVQRMSVALGRSIATQQIWDVLQALKWVKEQKQFTIGSISLYGRDEMGIVCLYAALLEGNVSHLIVKSPPDTHLRGPAVPMVLRETDIPELAGLLAPSRLSIIDDINNLFTKTQPYFADLSHAEKLNTYKTITEIPIY